MKRIIIDSLEFLVLKGKIKVYGFVIMPNHIHLVWRNLELNGKEYPDESFIKYTAHAFQKELKKMNLSARNYLVQKSDRKYQFWQRGSLAVCILSLEMLEQKLMYIHMNPLQAHWNLVLDPSEYRYSSCAFYERGDIFFEWLTDYREDFN